jgi:hypothetical protein
MGVSGIDMLFAAEPPLRRAALVFGKTSFVEQWSVTGELRMRLRRSDGGYR